MVDRYQSVRCFVEDGTMTTDDSALRTAVYVVLLLLAIPILMMLVMMPVMAGVGWDMHTAWHGSGGGWMWGLMMLVPVVVLAGFGYLLYTIVSSSNRQQGGRAGEELRAAYARGDLSDDEFEQRRKRLRQNEGGDS